MRDYQPLVYGVYLATTIALCTWLARTLFKNGAVFLKDVFPGRDDLAEAVNRLLVTGFAMLNTGYGFFLMDTDGAVDATEAFEVLARKLGILLVSLALIHFTNIVVFHKIADRRRQRELAPPIAPQRHVEGWQGPASYPQAPPPPAPRPNRPNVGPAPA